MKLYIFRTVRLSIIRSLFTVQCRVSRQNKFVKFVQLVGFIIKKFVTMDGHTIMYKLCTYVTLLY